MRILLLAHIRKSEVLFTTRTKRETFIYKNAIVRLVKRMATESFYQEMVIDSNESADALEDLCDKDIHFKFTNQRAPKPSEKFIAELSEYIDKL